MNCPHCNTPNDPSNQFCVNCGKNIHEPEFHNPSAGEYLGILTARLAIALLGIWILRSVVLGLSFVEDLVIPDIQISTASIINALVFLVIIGMLINYARDLVRVWPRAFPGYPELGTLLSALIYLGVLAALYAGLRPILVTFVPDREVMMLFQAILVVLALIIVARAGFIAYQGLSPWLAGLIGGFRQPSHTPPSAVNSEIKEAD